MNIPDLKKGFTQLVKNQSSRTRLTNVACKRTLSRRLIFIRWQKNIEKVSSKRHRSNGEYIVVSDP